MHKKKNQTLAPFTPLSLITSLSMRTHHPTQKPSQRKTHPTAEPISRRTLSLRLSSPISLHLSSPDLSHASPLHLPSLIHAHVRLLPPPPDTRSSPGPREALSPLSPYTQRRLLPHRQKQYKHRLLSEKSGQEQKRQMEAVVTCAVKTLGDVLIKEAQLLNGVHDHLKWIQTELESMRCFLKDADSKQKEDSRVRNWMEEIRKVSYDAEDVIDTFICSQRRKHTFVGRAKRYVSKPRTRHRVVKEIERIKLEINDISRKRETYGIRDINEGRQEASSSSQSLHEQRRLSTALEESEVVGLQEEINTLKKRLLNLEQRRCVISIVGMGGSVLYLELRVKNLMLLLRNRRG